MRKRLFVILTVLAGLVLSLQGCASTTTTDPARAAKDQADQAALDGMENSVTKDRNPDSPMLVKPPK